MALNIFPIFNGIQWAPMDHSGIQCSGYKRISSVWLPLLSLLTIIPSFDLCFLSSFAFFSFHLILLVGLLHPFCSAFAWSLVSRCPALLRLLGHVTALLAALLAAFLHVNHYHSDLYPYPPLRLIKTINKKKIRLILPFHVLRSYPSALAVEILLSTDRHGPNLSCSLIHFIAPSKTE